MSATHNGTCQVCGRQQAMTPGLLANHGYKIPPGWGHVGTCRGSGQQPVEIDVAILDRTRVDLTAAAAALAAQTIDAVESLVMVWKDPASRGDAWHRRPDLREVVRSEAEFEAWKTKAGSSYSGWRWADHRRYELDARHRRAEAMRDHVATLGSIRAERHGQPLVERKQRAAAAPAASADTKTWYTARGRRISRPQR